MPFNLGGADFNTPPFNPVRAEAPPVQMMPQTGFKPSGFLGGLQWGMNAQKYDQLMKQQMFLNKLAMDAEQQRVKEYKEGAGFRTDKRGFLHDIIRGMSPYGKEMGRAEAQFGISEKDFKRKTEYSKDAMERFFQKMKHEGSQEEWKRREQSFQMVSEITRQAQLIAQTQGQTAAQAFIAQQKSQAEKSGYMLPSNLADPRAWKQLNQISVDSLDHMRKMAEIEATGRNQRDVAAIQKQPSVEQQLYQLRLKVLGGSANEAEKKLYRSYVFSLWKEEEAKELSNIKMAYQMSFRDPKFRRQLDAHLKQKRAMFFQQFGLSEADSQFGEAPMFPTFADPNAEAPNPLRRRGETDPNQMRTPRVP